MRHRVCTAAALLAIAASSLVAKAQAAPAESRAEMTINSKALGKRTIYVVTPDEYRRGDTRYPILILLDADYREMFRLGVAQAAYLAENADGVPPMIVVAIVNGADRIHDMTPAATGSSIAEFPTAGGAPAFADFIFSEVLPAVRAKYRTLPTTVLAGFSAGGLFALHSAATWPERYQGVIAMDPAIWFNDGRPARDYADAIARSGARLRVFAAHHGVGDPDIDTTTRRFALRLDSIKPQSLGFAHRRYPADDHSMVPLSALPDGLRFIFEPVATAGLPIALLDGRADSAAVMRALKESEARYADSARTLLLPVELPEPVVNRVARFALNPLGNIKLTILVLGRNVALHPRSARALARLADGYLVKGDTASAIIHLRQAIGMWRSSTTDLPGDARAKLQALEGRARLSNR